MDQYLQVYLPVCDQLNVIFLSKMELTFFKNKVEFFWEELTFLFIFSVEIAYNPFITG